MVAKLEGPDPAIITDCSCIANNFVFDKKLHLVFFCTGIEKRVVPNRKTQFIHTYIHVRQNFFYNLIDKITLQMVPKNTGLFQKALAQLNWVDICFQKLILNFNSSYP